MEYTIKFPEDYVKPELPGGLEWVAALRSGKYLQGQELLISPKYNSKEEIEGYRYCCLGVLCELQGRPKVKEDEEYKGFDDDTCSLNFINPLWDILYCSGDFPTNVIVDVKLLRNGDILLCSNLAALNDKGLSFLEIADVIEQIWELK